MFDEEILHRYGTPLEPLHEDEVPSKKPVHLEDQIVTDENGKRRFHGAFTGGFSAGFWNTVGSLEGWAPQSFKSSRSEKAELRQRQRPEDFMDQEDLGQFGIAPQGIQTRDEFRKEGDEGRKRKLMQPSCGPIPGTPVLDQLLKPVKDKVAVRILKSMGWRPGQGVGPRQSKKDKKKTRRHNKRELYLMERYGVGQGGMSEAHKSNSMAADSDADSSADEEITFAPDDYDTAICLIKNNRYGLGYTGLSREPVLSKGARPAVEHINLFGPMEVLNKLNKKLSITGQAFGVGAFEEEDDDIYERDDLTKYDFSLEKQKCQKKSASHVQDHTIIDGFVAANINVQYKPPFIVELPPDFKPRNWALRQSRFAPLDPERANDLNLEKDFRKCGLGRHELTPQQRGDILGEHLANEPSTRKPQPHLHENKQTYTSREERSRNLLERISAKSSNFTLGGVITAEGEEKLKLPSEDVEVAVQLEISFLQTKAIDITKDIASTSLSSFKPFIGDDAKQKRYEQFLAANLRNEDEISSLLRTIQPVHLSEWDREMEKKEFIQARKIYKPLDGIMSDRFISEATVQTDKPLQAVEQKKDVENKITMVRTKTMWKPSSLLCKRFNIAEPYGGKMVEDKQPAKSKLSVFDYLESSVNTKANFQTPVIIPKHIEKPKPLLRDTRPAEHVDTNAKITKDIVLKTVDTLVPLGGATAVVKNLRYVPKTDLERRVEESRDTPASKKVELFRAIFEDSDEGEEEKGDDLSQATETAKITMHDATALALSLANPTSAAAANMLRNTSPPRGIFAALFAAIDKKETVTSISQTQTQPEEAKNSHEAPPKITFKPRCDRLQGKSETIESQADIYGPKVPQQLKKPSEIKESIVDEKLFKLFEKHKSSKYHSSIDVDDEWVEKNNVDSSDSSSSISSNSKKKWRKKNNKDRTNKQKKKDKKKSKKSSKSHKSKKSKQK